MSQLLVRSIIVSVCTGFFTGCTTNKILVPDRLVEPLRSPELAKFESEQELVSYTDAIADVVTYIETEVKNRRKKKTIENLQDVPLTVSASSQSLEEITVMARKSTSDENPEITNNQEAGVDEGDIVKVVGDYLIVLRKGRLYSTRIGRDPLTPLAAIDSIDVQKPGWSHDAWYDELLVHKNQIVVTGYSYDTDSSELNFLQLDDSGYFQHLDAWAISSDDYFSGENYASRLVGGRLRVYMPSILFDFYEHDSSQGWEFQPPHVARLPQNAESELNWKPLVAAQDIYRSTSPTLFPVLHTFLDCGLSQPTIECEAVAIMGPWSSVNYSSRSATYLWLKSESLDDWVDSVVWSHDEYTPTNDASIYRISGDDRSVSAVDVDGTPVNQFSFAERGKKLHALLQETQSSGTDDSYEYSHWLHTISLDEFGDSQIERPSPVPIRFEGGSPVVRFTADHLAIGTYQSLWLEPTEEDSSLLIQPLDGSQPTEVSLTHSSNRLEPIGQELFVLGNNADRHLEASTLQLHPYPATRDSIQLHDFEEAESRSHAFNFRQVNSGIGLIGFTARKHIHESDSRYTDSEAGDVVFLSTDRATQLYRAGLIDGSELDTGLNAEDCKTSCIDWYGNTRPFFIDGRIFALAGFTLVEAAFDGGAVTEMQRVDIRPTMP